MIMVRLASEAGIRTEYLKSEDLPGVWARSAGKTIQMHDGEIYHDEEHACFVYGHEMAHILNGIETDYVEPIAGYRFEAECDMASSFYINLAIAIYEEEMQNCCPNVAQSGQQSQK